MEDVIHRHEASISFSSSVQLIVLDLRDIRKRGGGKEEERWI